MPKRLDQANLRFHLSSNNIRYEQSPVLPTVHSDIVCTIVLYYAAPIVLAFQLTLPLFLVSSDGP